MSRSDSELVGRVAKPLPMGLPAGVPSARICEGWGFWSRHSRACWRVEGREAKQFKI